MRGRPPTTDPKIRFWRKVDKTAGCWNWTAGTSHNDYGLFSLSRLQGMVRAHRLSFVWASGQTLQDIQGKVVRHTCDNTRCVNPDHLKVGTHQQNSDDMIQRGRDRKAFGAANGRSRDYRKRL